MFIPCGPNARTRSLTLIPWLAALSLRKENCFFRNMVLLSANPVLAFGTLRVETTKRRDDGNIGCYAVRCMKHDQIFILKSRPPSHLTSAVFLVHTCGRTIRRLEKYEEQPQIYNTGYTRPAPTLGFRWQTEPAFVPGGVGISFWPDHPNSFRPENM